jgi:hypothetical protein
VGDRDTRRALELRTKIELHPGRWLIPDVKAVDAVSSVFGVASRHVRHCAAVVAAHELVIPVLLITCRFPPVTRPMSIAKGLPDEPAATFIGHVVLDHVVVARS